jgi:peptidylprolyl isomerase
MISRNPLLKACVLAALTLCMLALCLGSNAHAQAIPDKFLTPKEKKEIVTLPSGLRYVDVVEGTGPMPQKGQKVAVNYTGWLTNGEMFDSSVQRGKPYTYFHRVSQQIVGWSEGVSSMKVGGKRKLIIPPRLGYGADGNGGIPPNATLLFEIELISAEGTTMN